MMGKSTAIRSVVAAVISIAVVGLLAVVLWFVDYTLAPLLLNSRIERLGEKNLPKIMIERGSTVYCRMAADDFRFPLPRDARAVKFTVSGGFDTVDGYVLVVFDKPNHMTAIEYEDWVAKRVHEGGQVTAAEGLNGFTIKFRYFGDR
jgi:hypothetical protein